MGDAASARLVGTTLAGKYRVVQLLRSGGLADVYLAEMLTLRPLPAAPLAAEAPRVGRAARLVLKVLRAELAVERAVVERFERVAVAAARIVHPNVVRTTALERLPDGLPFCAMELLIGLDLADTLAHAGHLDPARAVRIAAGAAAGLGAVHAAGLVHLDVKPENVFLVHEPDGSEAVKVLDFGHASPAGDAAAGPPERSPDEAASGAKPRRSAPSGTPFSTPEYMAPELKGGASPAPAMDVSALGVMLGEMLTGRTPGSLREARAAPPAGLARVVERATAAEPGQRFATMAEVVAALLAISDEAPPVRSF
jgi:eukaryotic-like serine/threonine-protein kinase